MKVNMDMWDLNVQTVPRIFEKMISPHINLAESTVLDFGCGLGVKTLGIALNTPAAKVIGMDINDEFSTLKETYDALGREQEYPRNLSFAHVAPGEFPDLQEGVDCIFSWSVFEHISYPLIPEILSASRDLLSDTGVAFLQINPLYFSPFGSHLNSLIDEPWAHLLLQDNILKETLYATTKRTGHSGIKGSLAPGAAVTQGVRNGLWNCYRTLNKLTLPDLEALIVEAGYDIVDKVVGKTKHKPPKRLLSIFHEDILRTESVRLVFRKSKQRRKWF